MEIILTGRNINAKEAEKMGLVSKVFPNPNFTDEVLKQAKTLTNYSKTALIAAKESVNQSLESNLREGIIFERKVFHSLFHTKSQKEGMSAFLEKRSPKFN